MAPFISNLNDVVYDRPLLQGLVVVLIVISIVVIIKAVNMKSSFIDDESLSPACYRLRLVFVSFIVSMCPWNEDGWRVSAGNSAGMT